MNFNETIVYVATNEPAERESLAGFCVSEGLFVKTFCCIEDFRQARTDERIACLILDMALPGVGAYEMRNGQHRLGAPPVICLSAYSDLSAGVRAIKNGAIDFLLKPADHGQLRAAIELAFAKDRKNRQQRMERQALLKKWNALTPREREVFHHTVSGLLNKQGAAELGVAENTYQVHRGRVMKKMQANSLADLVRMSTKIEPILRSINQDGQNSLKLLTS